MKSIIVTVKWNEINVHIINIKIQLKACTKTIYTKFVLYAILRTHNPQ